MRALIATIVLVIMIGISTSARGDEPTPESIIERALKAGGRVRLIQPTIRTIARSVDRPCFVQPYEQASIYPRMAAYVKKSKVDIGDTVKKGQVLAELFNPELEQEWETKKALGRLAEAKVDLARAVVKVSEADIKTAEAALLEAAAVKEQRKANVKRWEIQVERLKREVNKGVVDPQVLDETECQLKATQAMLEEAKAGVVKAEARLLSGRGLKLQKEAAVIAATEELNVARSEAKRLAALVDYLMVCAPFDGIVFVRNISTGDLVVPRTGDVFATRTGEENGPTPMFVIDRADIVRIFVKVPEVDANYIKGDIESGKEGSGTKAAILIKAYSDKILHATVTRTAWALDAKSRTLLAEIDLPNPGYRILPGMSAYAKLIIGGPRVWTLPRSAVFSADDRTYVWSHASGKAIKTEILTAVSDGEWMEVTHRQVFGKKGQSWAAIDGTEQVILADPASLSDGGTVTVADADVAGPKQVGDFRAISFKGEFTAPRGQKVSVDGLFAGPGLFRVEMTAGKALTRTVVGAGDTFWLKEGDKVEEVHQGNDKGTFDTLTALSYAISLPDRLQVLKGKQYRKTIVDEAAVNGAPAVVLRVNHELYPEALLYLDMKTGLLVKSQLKVPASALLGDTAAAIEIFYDNYKVVNDVLHFTRLKLRFSATIECELRDLGFHTNLDAAAFKKP